MTTVPNPDGSSEHRQHFDAAPPMVIDPTKTYTATMVTSKGTMEIVLDPWAPRDGQQLRLPGALPLLRRHRLSPRDPRFRPAGRRPDRHRHRRPGLPLRRRAAQGPAATRSARWPWPTPGRTPTAASSSSSRAPTASACRRCTRSSARSCAGSTWSRRSTTSAAPRAGRASRSPSNRSPSPRVLERAGASPRVTTTSSRTKAPRAVHAHHGAARTQHHQRRRVASSRRVRASCSAGAGAQKPGPREVPQAGRRGAPARVDHHRAQHRGDRADRDRRAPPRRWRRPRACRATRCARAAPSRR